MKGILCACLLASLQSMTAEAYEADIHYSTTYVLARAVGWPEADALTIASANQGVDENQDTVAALEMDTTPRPSVAGYVTSSLHQAEKNLRFHCFSKTRGQAGQISADVREVISHHFAEVPEYEEDPRRNARRLIALGVALHCQQDASSHAGFGGSCGSYPGSCYGHTYQTFFDQVAFRLLGKHYYDPDHPGVSGPRVLEALQGTVSELEASLPKASPRSIPTKELVALSAALRGSGLELPDELRRDCNRYIVGKWLFDFIHAGGEKLAPGIAGTCRNASLASATIVRIPAPRFPRLNADASPYLVRADGSYQRVRDGDFNASSPLSPNYETRKVKDPSKDPDKHEWHRAPLLLGKTFEVTGAVTAETTYTPGMLYGVVGGLAVLVAAAVGIGLWFRKGDRHIRAAARYKIESGVTFEDVPDPAAGPVNRIADRL